MRGEESVSLQRYPDHMVHVVLAGAAQGSPDDFLIHGYVSGGGATGLGSFLRSAAYPDFATRQDRIDLF